MQAGLTTTDRRLLVGAVLAVVLLVAASIVFAPATAQQEAVVPSIWSNAAGGARAAFLLLVQLHYDVRRWEESPLALGGGSPGQVLILAEPTEAPSKAERNALAAFVRNGGRILFCGPAIHAFFPEAVVAPQMFDLGKEEFTARVPAALTRGASKIVMRRKGIWARIGAEQLALYGETEAPAVVAWRIGDGELLWWAGATPLTNAGISQADNLSLFINAVSMANRAPTVYWDEYFHGERASLWNYVERTPLYWGLLQAALLGVAVVFTYSRRWGPIVMPAPVSRLSPLEFVETLGGLYQHAGAASLAVEESARHLRTRLTQQLGLPAHVSDATLAEAAGQRLGWSATQVAADFATAGDAARNPKLQARKALVIVQSLEAYLSRLRIRPSGSPEKN